ncbi:MAG: hypothetical protein RR982_06100 [Kiritimatiellia bacterium]
MSNNPVLFLGPELFSHDAKGVLNSRIGTIFLRTPGMVTLRGIHATQRMAWIDELNRQRKADHQPPLTEAEEEAEIAMSVDLLFDEKYALIRPDPTNIALAIQGDELLQKFVSKLRIRYLNIQNKSVRDALRQRGEAWRMAPMPLYEEEIRALILNAHVGINGRAIYYYNRLTGTRFLTLDAFRSLGSLPIEELRSLLLEIRKNLQGRNRFANPEVDFLPPRALSVDAFAKIAFDTLSDSDLRANYQALLQAFGEAVPTPALQKDDIANPDWRKALSAVLIHANNDTGVTAVLEELSPEFFMQIEWLPGGRVMDGELFFDPIFAEADAHREDEQLRTLCDHRARAILFNYLREYSQIEYVNIGRTRRSLSGRTGQGPRAFVYIVEIKELHKKWPQVKIIRIQRWTVASHLTSGKPLLQSIIDAEDYTDYVMDRRLGARQLGMHLPPLMMPRSFRETVLDAQGLKHNVWTGYFERDYIFGRATDKIPETFYASPIFNLRFCQLLGQAAAPNIIVGRATVDGNRTIFDDGDEVIVLNAFQLPERLILSEPTGSFTDYKRAYSATIADYAAALNKRKAWMPNFAEAAEEFVRAFETELTRIQLMYREHRQGFSSLFCDRPRDANGSMAFRWECVLARLDAVNAHALACQLHDYINF